MKKNLKKVLSAVIAMALAFSLVPASFAAKVTLSDVADTASYATAVNTLVALKVINGYEDGTFLPDNKITRAEATKVMVAALNQLDAAEGMKGATQFTDVESRHEWATGYINAGVQNGYINGMGDGTFAPDAEVTYAQMVKMLVSAMNYDQYAAYLGGYPNGYLSIAASEKITDGVNANANDAVTRAQVAQLVYNALNTPIVENTGMTWTSDGKLVPTIKKMDGKGTGDAATNYKSILTEYFNAYYVEGYITETAKGGALKKDEVKFGISKTEKYDHDEFGSLTAANGDAPYTIATKNQYTVLVGDTDAADYQGVYASAIIMEDDYEDRTLISFVPSGKNKSVKVDADLIDGYDATDIALDVYASENATKTTSYKLAKTSGALDIDVYVNGFKVEPSTANNAADKGAITDDDTLAAILSKYVLNNSVGEVELVDTYKTDGYYDAIYVNSYVTAIVSSVITSSNDIVFKKMHTAGNIDAVAQLTLDEEENEDLNYKILYNGEEITLAELKEDDILSISCNVNELELDQCDDFVIYVSRDVKTGKYTSRDTDDNEVTIGGEVYGFVNAGDMLPSSTLSSEYTIYVDAFGRIVKAEVNTSAAKYAIVDMIINNSTGAYDGHRIRMFTAEGELKTIVLEQDAVVKIPGVSVTNNLTDIQARVGSSMETRTAIQNRVVTYKVSNSTGYIKELTFLNAEKTTSNATDEYKADSNKLGSIYFSDATKVVDAKDYYKDWSANPADRSAAKYADLKAGTKADLTDGVGYTAYGYAKQDDGNHAFVVVTEGKAGYNEETRFAVVASTVSEGTDETTGETIYTVEIAGQDEALVISEDAKIGVNDAFSAAALNIGDVIVYQEAAGVVEDIQILFSTSTQADDFTELADEVLAGSASVAIPAAAKRTTNWTTDWTANPDPTEDTIRVMIGAVADKKDKSMTLVAADNAFQTDMNGNAAAGVYELDLSDDTNVFTYNYDKKANARVDVGLADSIIATTFADTCYADEDKEVIDWTVEQSRKNIKLAVVKTLDDEVIDVLYITGKYDTTTGATYATADFSAPADSKVIYNKAVSAMGSDFAVVPGAISGTMTEITGWTDYATDARQDGYFAPISFTTAKAGTVTIVKKLNGVDAEPAKTLPTAAGEDWDLIVRVAGTDEVEVADELVITVSATGATPVTYTFALPEA